jgi:hypothetical protein
LVILILGAVVLGAAATGGLMWVQSVIDPFREEYDDTPRQYVRILIPMTAGVVVAVVTLLVGLRAIRRR